jgi:hypothetical protein
MVQDFYNQPIAHKCAQEIACLKTKGGDRRKQELSYGSNAKQLTTAALRSPETGTCPAFEKNVQKQVL